ncbi:MAG: PstS family phosphate ABC transporter substrate-binding protein [Dehalococcoidia bacterium]
MNKYKEVSNVRHQLLGVGWRPSRRLGLVAGLLALGVTLVVVAAGCGDDKKDDNEQPTSAATQPADDTPSGGIDYGSLSGQIRIDGSSTVFPISEAVAEEFASVASDVRVNVAFSGTGGGFELFCAGDIPISDASRPIKDDEIAACAENGIDDIVEIQVAIDALTVMVNPANDFVTCLTVQQLHDLFRTGGYTNWNQVDASYPDEAIDFYFPGTDSGTFDYFVEAIIEGVDENATHRGDGTASEDDNVLALGIENDEHSIGYFGYAYYQGGGSGLKAVEIDGGGGCVAPSLETALDGSYVPLSRPLFIYTRASLLQERPEVLGFVNFYLENAEALVTDVGYVPMPEDLFAEQVAKIEPYLP